jgi:hypothetical protein
VSSVLNPFFRPTAQLQSNKQQIDEPLTFKSLFAFFLQKKKILSFSCVPN